MVEEKKRGKLDGQGPPFKGKREVSAVMILNERLNK